MQKLQVQLPEHPGNTMQSKDKSAELLEQAIKSAKTKSFGLPERFRDKTLDNITGFADKLDKAKSAIMANKGVFFYGGCGTGKTHLACGLMRFWYESNLKVKFDEYFNYDVIKKQIEPQFLPSVEFFLRLKETFKSENQETENMLLTKLSHVPFLVIDDVGAEKVSDWSRQSFYTLIDRRYRQMRQTVITSNLSLSDLAKNIDDRIASRITEMCEIINLGNDDYRLKIKK